MRRLITLLPDASSHASPRDVMDMFGIFFNVIFIVNAMGILGVDSGDGVVGGRVFLDGLVSLGRFVAVLFVMDVKVVAGVVGV